MKSPDNHSGSNVEGLLSHRAVLIAVVALGCSGAAPAAQSAAHAPDPRELGKAEAVLDYCAKVDPSDAAKIHTRLKQLMTGASKESIAQARQSEDYQKARRSVEGFLAHVDQHNAARVCSRPMAAAK